MDIISESGNLGKLIGVLIIVIFGYILILDGLIIFGGILFLIIFGGFLFLIVGGFMFFILFVVFMFLLFLGGGNGFGMWDFFCVSCLYVL